MPLSPEKRAAYNRAYYQANIEKEKARAKANVLGRNRARRKNMGIVDPPSETHRGPCELCGRVPPPESDANHCDHDHATGLFRGWLCKTCNTRMAVVDNREWLKKAEAYRDKDRRPTQERLDDE